MTGQLIVSKQIEDAQLKRLAAKKQLYLNENIVCGVQMAVAIATAIIGAIVQNKVKDSEPYVVIVSAAFGLIDVVRNHAKLPKMNHEKLPLGRGVDRFLLNPGMQEAMADAGGG